ncbi:hypothetical protein ABEB36_014802 [Hypothenemus hampei]|uniref:DUF7041 domain-containing protein n=1 Tax=Hypothenemus hampei TaxID=57062 RepID=A0ABD1E181_HYPHA
MSREDITPALPQHVNPPIPNIGQPQVNPSPPVQDSVQVEALFEIRNIRSDSTKYNYVLSVMDGETLNHVSDVIRSTLGADRYCHEGDYTLLNREIILPHSFNLAMLGNRIKTRAIERCVNPRRRTCVR